MKCAIYVLYDQNEIQNIEENYKILSKTIDHHILISFINEFNFSFKFTQVFCKPEIFIDETDRVLKFFKILSNILKYLNIKRYNNAVIVSGKLKLNEFKTNSITCLLDSIQSIEDVDFVLFKENGVVTDSLILCRIWFLMTNLEYYDCNIEDFKRKTNYRDHKFYIDLFLTSPFIHTRNLEDYI